jgi:peptidoglycan/LPS O-acetylase OafA/YrhL
VNYRPEIDGLRALAVIPVILFHAGFEYFRGGFVGVDVFFVISGYLITTIIVSEQEAGTFSLLNFYERRARRILPALFLVMLVSVIAAYFWLSAPDLKDFSRSLMAVSTFLSNFLFLKETGYWDTEGELKPLLHTWSLAVEEQYYLLFPPFLMMMWRFRKRWMLGSILVIGVISLVAAQWGSHSFPSANFYLLPTRAWELAIGAGIAFYFLHRKKEIGVLGPGKIVSEVLGLSGLLMVGYAVYAFDETVPFPGIYALIPVIGAGLIVLFSSPQTIVGRLLGTKLLVGVGLISYSAYLWHFPLYVYARHLSLTKPGEQLFLLLALASFLLAYLSWRFVERPFRNKTKFDRRAIFKFTFVGSAFFIIIGLAGDLSDGWQGRFDDELTEFLPESRLSLACKEEAFQSGSLCEYVGGQNKLTLLVGDSHSGSIAYEMQQAFSNAGIGLWHAYSSGCPPIRNIYRVDRGDSTDLPCYYFNEGLYQHIRDNEDIEYVVMMARWTLSIEGSRFDNKEGGIEFSANKPHFDLVTDGKPEYHSAYEHRSELSKRVASSVQDLLDMGKKVILVYPVPEAGWDVPRYVSRYYMMHSSEAFRSDVGSTSHNVFNDRNARTYGALDSAGEHPNLYRVYPERLLCNTTIDDRCIVQENGHSLYKDDDHLSNAGARLVVDQIIRQIK